VKTTLTLCRGALLVAAFSVAAPFASFTFAAAPAAVAADSELGEAAGSVPIPAGITRAQAVEAAVAALNRREWGVKSQSSDRVVGYLKHRSNEATVTFVISDTKLDLFCVGYQIDKKTGVREKPEQPKSWLNNLRGDITKIFNTKVTKS
jgi:hypothetical protein